MKLLLDTHTFLWFVNDSPDLSLPAKDLLEDDANDLFLSPASVWEMAIKSSTSKLHLPAPIAAFVPAQLIANDILLLPIEVAHLGVVETLPFHHKDPFDRLLAAQSLSENLPMISIDAVLDLYGVQRFW